MFKATLFSSISIAPSCRKVHFSSHRLDRIRMKEFTRIMPLQVAHFNPKSYLVIGFRTLSSEEKFLIDAKNTNSYSSLFYLRVSLIESTIISMTFEMCRGRSTAISYFN